MVTPDGAQAERTALAWRRTALAAAVCGLGALRFLPAQVGAVGLVPGVAGLVWAAALAWQAHHRYPAARTALADAAAPPGSDARPPGPAIAATAALTITAGLASLVILGALLLS